MAGAATVPPQYHGALEPVPDESLGTTVAEGEQQLTRARSSGYRRYRMPDAKVATLLDKFTRHKEPLNATSITLQTFVVIETTRSADEREFLIADSWYGGQLALTECTERGLAPNGERRRRNAAVIRLLSEWLADESGYDEETWPALKDGLEASRTSFRGRFRD